MGCNCAMPPRNLFKFCLTFVLPSFLLFKTGGVIDFHHIHHICNQIDQNYDDDDGPRDYKNDDDDNEDEDDDDEQVLVLNASSAAQSPPRNAPRTHQDPPHSNASSSIH